MRGLKGHRWLIAACETKIVMTDLVSQAFREVPRTVLDGRAPTCLAILCKCSPLLLGESQAEAHAACVHGASYYLGHLTDKLLHVVFSCCQCRSLVSHGMYSAHRVMQADNACMIPVRLQGSLAIKMRLLFCNLLRMVMEL